MTSQQDTELLLTIWKRVNRQGEYSRIPIKWKEFEQALTSWKDKEVKSAWSDGYHKGWKARKQTTSEGNNGQTKSS